MKREAEKKNAKNVSNSNSEKITLSAADLAKKPIGVRRKSTKPLEIDSGDSKYKGGLDSRLLVRKKAQPNEKITKVFHNAMYDVCWIRAVTGKKMKGRIVDTMIAASVIDENRFKYSLDSLSKDYLNEEKYKYDLQQKTLEWSGGMVKDPMSNMHKLPASIVKEYAKQDVNLTYKLWKLFDKKIDEILYTKDDGEQKTCRKIFELETKLFLCLVDMKLLKVN